MEKRIKATKIEVVPSQHQPTSNNTSSAHKSLNASSASRSTTSKQPASETGVFGGFVALGILMFVFALNFCGDSESDSSSSSSNSVLDSALEKGGSGRATEMTAAEMEAFRIEQQRISNEHKQRFLSGLTPAEKALRDYEDKMILQGETQSNPYYEELQRKPAESR